MNRERPRADLCTECGEPFIENPAPFIDDERPQVKRIGALGMGGLLISGAVGGIGFWSGYPEFIIAGGAGAGMTMLTALIAELKAHRRYDRLNRKF